MFADRAFADGVRPRRRELDQLGAGAGAGGLLLHRRREPRRAAPGGVSFTVPTGNFGDIYAGLIARRMGLPIERLVIATNQQRHPAPHAADRRPPQGGRARRPSARRWTSRSRPTSSARCSTPTGATPRPSAPTWPRLRRGRLRGGAGGDGDAARVVRLGPRLGGRDRRRPSPGRCARRASWSARTPPSASTWPRGSSGATPMVTLATAHPAKFPDAVEAATGHPAPPSAAHGRPV